MEGLIVGNRDNYSHVIAVLKRMTQWGMLTYYPVVTMMEGVESVQSASIIVFYRPLMDWTTMLHFLEALSMEELDPLRGLDEMVFIFMFPERNAFYTFAGLKERVHAGGQCNGTP